MYLVAVELRAPACETTYTVSPSAPNNAATGALPAVNPVSGDDVRSTAGRPLITDAALYVAAEVRGVSVYVPTASPQVTIGSLSASVRSSARQPYM